MQCLLGIMFAAGLFLFPGDRPTSLPEARDAVEHNLRSSEGRAYDQQLGTEFFQKHLAPLRQCKQTAGKDLRSFWILLKLDKDGTVKEVLFSPETALGTCARDALLKDKFLQPPTPAYWVSVYLKIGQ